MKCQVCQYDVPGGVAYCPNCGTPVSSSDPYGRPQQSSSPNQGIAPTVLASSSPPVPDPYGAPPPVPDPYGAPPPVPDPYGAPPPSSPYGAPPYGTPPPSAPYGAPSTAYGAPPPPAYDPNAAGFGAGTPYMQPQFVPPQQPKSSNRGCIIAVVIVLSLFVLIVGGIIAAVVYAGRQAVQGLSNLSATATAGLGTVNADSTPTISTGTTPTTAPSGNVPSASQIDPTASANIKNAQTSSSVDSNYKPTNVTSSFTIGQTIYITYDLSGKPGYLNEKRYSSDGTLAGQTTTPLKIDSGDSNGYVRFTATESGSFVAGLYWCQQSDCSDAALAQVVNFTIS